MPKKNPTKIAVIGFDSSQQASLELFISRYADGYELVPEKHAEAVVFNADQTSTKDFLETKPQEKDSKLGIVVSAEETQWRGMISLVKPYGVEELKSSLEALSAKLATLSVPASDSEAQNVVDEFHASFLKGEEVHTEIAGRLERRKDFQQGLMARKRRAEQLASGNITDAIEAIKEPLAEVLARQPHKSISENFEQDLLALTKEAIAQSESSLLNIDSDQQAEGVPLLLDPNIQDVQDSCGNLPDLDLNGETSRRNLFFNSEGQLLSIVLDARRVGLKDQQRQFIKGLPNQYLQYDPQEDAFFCTLDYDLLLQMAQIRFRFGELTLHAITETVHQDSTDFLRFPALQLLWRLASYSSKGKLAEGLSLTRRYQLDTKLPSNVIVDLPRTAAIIKLWQSEAMSANELMSRLHVEQRFVFPFMTAATSLGWLK